MGIGSLFGWIAREIPGRRQHPIAPARDRVAGDSAPLRPGAHRATESEPGGPGSERDADRAKVRIMGIRPGCQVYGRKGGHIGVVVAVGPGVMDVRATTPFTPLYHVPIEAVIGTLPGGRELFLSCLVDELDRMEWQHRPKPDQPLAPGRASGSTT